MDLGKITVFLTRDFPDTNYIFIPVREQRSNDFVGKPTSDSLSRCKFEAIQHRTIDVSTRPVSMDKCVGLDHTFKGNEKEYNNLQGNERKLQIIFKYKAKETITDLTMSPRERAVTKMSSNARITGAKTGRKRFVPIDQKQYIVEVVDAERASEATKQPKNAATGNYCRKKLKASCSGVNNEESGLQCILIGHNSTSISTVKFTRRSDGVLICPEIMSNRFKCTNGIKGVALETHFEKSHMQCVATNDGKESGSFNAEKNSCLTENVRSDPNDLKDIDSGIDCEEAEPQSHISDYDFKKKVCEIDWSLNQSALPHRNGAIAEKNKESCLGQMLPSCKRNDDTDEVQKDDCHGNKAKNELITRQIFPNETDEDVTIACSKTLNRIIKTLQLFVEDDDYDSASGLLRNKNTKSVPPPLDNEGKCSEVITHQSINYESGNEAKSNENLNSLTILTSSSPEVPTTIDSENQDTNLRKSPDVNDKSSSIPAILHTLPVDLRRESIDCIPDKSLDSSPIDLTFKNTTVGNDPPINPTISGMSKQSLNPIYEPISPPVVKRPIYEPISPPVVKRPIYEPISPPASPITISNATVSPFTPQPAKTTLPAICNPPAFGRSNELVSPVPTEEELKKKAEKEFLKELWQEGSGRIVRKEGNDKEINHKNSRLEETLITKQTGISLIEYMPALGSNYAADRSTPSNCKNTSAKDCSVIRSLLFEKTNMDNASVFNSALQQKRDHTRQSYPSQQKGFHGGIKQSNHPGQQQGKLRAAKSSGTYYTTAGNYETLRTPPMNPAKFSPNFPWTTNIDVGNQHRGHLINQSLESLSAEKLNAPTKAADKFVSNKLRDISNNINQYCESPVPSDEHRQHSAVNGPQYTPFSITAKHARASCRKCAYAKLRKTCNESRPGRQSATLSDYRRIPQSEATGLRNVYANALNYNESLGTTAMLDGAIRNPGPSMQDAMPPPASAPSRHGDGTENHYRQPTVNSTTQAQFQSSASQAMNATRHSNTQPESLRRTLRLCVTPDGSVRLAGHGQPHAQQYQPLPNGQYLQLNRPYANGVHIPAQQKQFRHPGQFSTVTRIESGNVRSHVPPWRGNPRQGHAASGSNATTTGIITTNGGSYVITNSNGHNADSSTANVAMPNPPVYRSIPLQPIFRIILRSAAETIPIGRPNWSQLVQTNNIQQPTPQNQPIQYQQPVQTSNNQQPTPQNQSIPSQQPQIPRNLPPTSAATNQLPTVQTGPIRFQPELSHDVPPTTAASNHSPILHDQPVPLQPDLSFSLSMKVPCHGTGGAVNAKASTVRERAANQTIVLQNCQIINPPTILSPISGESTAEFMLLQRPEAVPANPLSASRRLAGNALPGDMLMTTRIVGLPLSKKNNVKRNQPRIVQHFQPFRENRPDFNSRAYGISVSAAEATSTADEPNSPISQSDAARPAPFVRLTPSSTRFSSTPAPAHLRVENRQNFFSSVTKITSVEELEHASTQSSTSSDSPPCSVQTADSENTENTAIEALHEVANTLVEQSTPVSEKCTVASQTSNDTSTSQSISKEGPEQTVSNSLKPDERVESPTSDNQNDDDSYGYDYNSLAKALQSKKSKTDDTSSVVQTQVEEESKGRIATKAACHDDISQHERQLLPPSSPSTSGDENEHGTNNFGYDYESMVRARQRAEQQRSQSKSIEMDIQKTPMKSRNTNQPFGSPFHSSPSGFGNRNPKRIIPPISSDTDSDMESDVHYRRDRSKIRKRKRKWRRIIEPSDSSDSDETGIELRVHSPKSSAFDDESASANVLKRKQDDYSEEPVQKLLKCSISPTEFAYMASCRVILQRIDDVFVSLKTLPHGQSDVKERADSLGSETVQSHSNQSLGWAHPDREIPSFRQLNDNITDSASTSHSDKSENASLNTNHDNASKQSLREKQTDVSDTETSGQTSMADDRNSDTTDQVSSPLICFEHDDDIIENTILYKTDQRWQQNRKSSFETDSTVTTESGMLPNQSYLSDSEEIYDLSNIEENESPYHSDEDETAFSDYCSNDGEILKHDTKLNYNRKSGKSPKKTKTVTFEDDFLPEKENTWKAGYENKKFSTVSHKVSSRRCDSDVENQPFDRIKNKHLPSSDEDDDFTSSYTSSNSGSPVKFDRLSKDGEWPFSDESEVIAGTDDSTNISHIRSTKKSSLRPNDIRHQLNDLVKDRKSLVSIPEVRLTKFLKLRNRRTHKSRERRTKKEYLKEVGLLGTNVDLAFFEYKKLQASLRPIHKNVLMKTKIASPIEGCSSTRGSIDAIKYQNWKRRSRDQTLSSNDSSNGELLKGYKDGSCCP